MLYFPLARYICGSMEELIIRWWGHACFELVYGGVSLTIDPHDGESIGLKKPGARSEYVIMSHDHFDHNSYRSVIKEGGRWLSMAIEVNSLGPYRVEGIETFHDKERGRRRGRNVAYVVEAPNGVRVLHTGDLGHLLGEDHVKRLERIHISMLPVGGTITIDHREALEIFRSLNTQAMIPMHYWVRGVNLPLEPIDRLIERARGSYEIYMVDGNEIRASLRRDALAISSQHLCVEINSNRSMKNCGVEIAGDRKIVILKIG